MSHWHEECAYFSVFIFDLTKEWFGFVSLSVFSFICHKFVVSDSLHVKSISIELNIEGKSSYTIHLVMGSFSGSCEIVEAEDELNSGKAARIYQTNSEFSMGEKNQKLPMLQLGCKDNLENHINKLFESVTLKTSLRDSGLLQDVTSIKMKNTLKKPITVGVSQSPRVGPSEPATLKQALRDLCISKASEMAAMKRLSKSTNSPRVSEVGKIKDLYNSVLGEGSQHESSSVESKGSGIEISASSEKRNTVSLDNTYQSHQAANVTSSCATVQSSSETVIATKENNTASSSVEIDLVSSSSKSGLQSQQLVSFQTGKQTSADSSSISNTDGSRVELPECDSVPQKIGNKASASKVGRKVRLQAVPSSSTSTSVGGNRVRGTHNAPRTVKSVIRNKNLNKKKPKQDSGSAPNAATSNEMNDGLVPGTTPLVCERCRCTLESTSKEKSQDSVASDCANPGDAVSSSIAHYGANKSASTSTNCNRSKAVAKVKKNGRLKEQLEFSQSSKSSQECSSGTSTSDESNVSGASFGNRPHMSKDVRWAAIRQAHMQHGVLGLRQFNLLKNLGCGDIGTVYLAELIGTNCLFAIKVMDNEFLAIRKKISRAQTERDILRILDHPFLPTLYAQFTSDNLSCLIMEYCPGGDLHVLRQKQPGRSFTELAARFYVAEVLLALEYLHMLGIVYRDLKPENILVREDGHIMLTDFDLSLRCDVSPTLLKSSFDSDPERISGPCARSSCIEPFCIEPSCQVSCFSPIFLPAAAKTKKLKADLAAHIRSLPQLVAEPTDARSNSFVGTHEYLAPEIIKGEGHGAAVDWWTFGVFLYELLYGRTPFKGSNNEETLANVVLQSLRFPESPFISFQARDLIRGLLVKEPENRLGSEKGAAEIKQHPFFEGLNWALIRCAVPPELPEFCDFGVPGMTSLGNYFECKATGEHVEFELF